MCLSMCLNSNNLENMSTVIKPKVVNKTQITTEYVMLSSAVLKEKFSHTISGQNTVVSKCICLVLFRFVCSVMLFAALAIANKLMHVKTRGVKMVAMEL